MSNDLLQDQIRLIGREANLIFDVGAHTGQSTLEYLTNFPHARIFSFEPDATNAAAALAAAAHYRQRCSLHQLAISDSDGSAQFHINSHDGTHSLFAIGEQEYWAGPAHEIRQVTVQTKTLDSFIADHDLSQVDILKMDIQGGELAALKGAHNLLTQARIRLLALEVEFKPLYKNQPLFWDVCAFLHGFNYSFFKLYDPIYHHKNRNVVCWGDAIFLAPEFTTINPK
jgi:FkbM family methyltransferase